MAPRLVRDLFGLFNYSPSLLTVADPADPTQAVPVSDAAPLPVKVIGGELGGGSATDTSKLSKEATQLQLLTHMQAANGNSYILASQAQGEGVHVRQARVSVTGTQSLALGAAVTALSVPALTLGATVHVITGRVRRAIGAEPSASTPLLIAGDSEQLSGDEVAAWRAQGQGAVLWIEYRGQA